MAFPAHVFREYDIRGIADTDLTDDLVRATGVAFAEAVTQRNPGKALRIAVGRDCRLSSDRIFAALAQGLAARGVQVLEIGVGPTPLLYFAVHHLGADAGLMITGSHNDGPENGLKMMMGTASFFGDEIRALRARVAALLEGAKVAAPGSASDATANSVPDANATYLHAVRTLDISADYLARLTRDIDLRGSGLKVVVDAGNGSAGPLGVAAIRRAGLEPEALFCEMDGHFPNHHPDPTVEKNLAPLIERMRASGAQVGLAWDGDGDRLGAVDATGEIIWGDKLMVLFARDVLRHTPGAAILGEVKCSQTLYDDIAKHGGRPILWKTGHSNIKTKMKEEGALLAGEMSGHLFFADRYYGYDDGIYGALRLLQILANSKKTMGELLADVPRTYVTPELRVDCADAIKFEVVNRVRDRYRKTHEVIDVDGARILFGEGAWGLVRASNTGPILVLRFEATSEQRRDALRAEVEAVVAEERRAVTG
jgi:phosphomannomutase/phosphoglucomutase